MAVLRMRARVYGHTTTNMPKMSTPLSILPSIALNTPLYCPLLPCIVFLLPSIIASGKMVCPHKSIDRLVGIFSPFQQIEV